MICPLFSLWVTMVIPCALTTLSSWESIVGFGKRIDFVLASKEEREKEQNWET